MVNIKKVNIIVFAFHFHEHWPFNSLERLLRSWQQHGNFFRPLTYMMWGMTLQLHILAFTCRSRPLTLSGWHSEADEGGGWAGSVKIACRCFSGGPRLT